MQIKQNIRIGETGSGGTGKSTSAKFISNNLNLPLIKSASRTVYENLNLTEKKVLQLSPKEKLDLQITIFDTKIKLDQIYREYVTDRTILDHLAYCLAYCSSFIDDSKFLYYEQKVKNLMQSSYSHVFYFPFGYWEPKNDGIRQELKAWQAMIDSILRGYINKWNLSVIEVPQTEGIDYRNEFMLKIIKNGKR